jgi:bifunctional UDP-N-acetylglucosamine pyrophosphorylase / glucosamine-1-phosphate N-acetyltransferase
MEDLLTIILAAGQATRMKSSLNKVLHPLGGKPIVQHVIDSVLDLSSRIIVVVGYQGDQVESRLNHSDIYFVKQKEQLGTGHAVLQAVKYITEVQGSVLILCGDVPLLSTETIKRLITARESNQAGVALLTAILDNPRGYGRIIRDEEKSQIAKIVEERDATPIEREIKEINSGVYCFDSRLLKQSLSSLNNDNSQGEYYLTDVISYLYNRDEKIIPVVVEDQEEVLGINDRIDLARVERIVRRRINQRLMKNGVTIIDPETTYIDEGVTILPDTVIYPFTFIEGKTKIGSNTVIGPYCRIVNAEIGNNVNLRGNCYILESTIEEETDIGPLAHIRPGCKISREAKVGDFVELKKAIVGQGSKVPHLSYVGDAEIGEKTNIGAGTVFANYDGKDKHKTIVGNSVFIGSNTTLIAPVKVGNKGKTGAGAVVTRDVPENTTVVGVPARIMKKEEGGNSN